LDLYEFLIHHRFILDDGAYDFYRNKVDGALAGVQTDRLARLRLREQQMDAAAQAVQMALSKENGANAVAALAPLGNSSAHVAHLWTVSNARALLEAFAR
jgi:hypothetical protein